MERALQGNQGRSWKPEIHNHTCQQGYVPVKYLRLRRKIWFQVDWMTSRRPLQVRAFRPSPSHRSSEHERAPWLQDRSQGRSSARPPDQADRLGSRCGPMSTRLSPWVHARSSRAVQHGSHAASEYGLTKPHFLNCHHVGGDESPENPVHPQTVACITSMPRGLPAGRGESRPCGVPKYEVGLPFRCRSVQ